MNGESLEQGPIRRSRLSERWLRGGVSPGRRLTFGSRRAVRCAGELHAHWPGVVLRAWLRILVVPGLLLVGAQAGVRSVHSVGLTVGDLDRQLAFYTNALPFVLINRCERTGPEMDVLYGLPDGSNRSATLRLGLEEIVLTEFLTEGGRPIPPDSRSFDHWFQHIAIVVSDMDRAYEHLRRHRVKHVSTAPQTLPAWNPDAGGIRAFYFHDPEDHVLEVIWFPPGKGDPRWQVPATNLFLGIDHTAIVVRDTDRSLAFYRDRLGMRVAGTAENHGVEQEHLNQVFGARVRITALRADHGPGIEFLEYLAPPGGRALPADSSPKDHWFWHTTIFMEGLERLVSDPLIPDAWKVSTETTRFCELEGNRHARFILRDPDGHALELVESGRCGHL